MGVNNYYINAIHKLSYSLPFSSHSQTLPISWSRFSEEYLGFLNHKMPMLREKRSLIWKAQDLIFLCTYIYLANIIEHLLAPKSTIVEKKCFTK